MSRPGTQVVIGKTKPNPVAPADTGVLMIAGKTSKGPTNTALLCHNMDEVTARFGARIPTGQTVPTSLLWDACDAAFNSGVTKMYVGRFAGPAAAPAAVTLMDSTPAASLTVQSNGPGPSTLSVAVIAGTVGSTVKLVVTDTATSQVIDTSPNLSSVSDAVQWARFSPANAIRIIAAGANLPVVAAAAALASGTDDSAHITDTTRIAALPVLFPKGLGPAQMAVPGGTTPAMQAGLSDYCVTLGNRVALIDGPDTASEATAAAALLAWQSACTVPLSETAGIFSSPWRVVPGTTGSFSRVVPPSSIIAGLIATSDAKTGNPNIAAAGKNGVDNYSLGSSQADWSDADRETLNNLGVACFTTIYGEQRLYGFRSGAKSADVDAFSNQWESFAASRLRMALVNDLDILGQEFLFDQLDGQGKIIAEFNGAIAGKLSEYYNLGALYGASAADAFVIDTGPTVNTPTTIAAQELHAKIGIKISPFNEFTYFEVTSVALSEVLAA